MVVIGYLLFALLLLRFLVVLVNFFSNPFLPNKEATTGFPKVSILIPARNEEENLPNILSDLQKLDYPNFEVIVCNDHSTDTTESILQLYSSQNHHFSYFNNIDLPEGWVGKNFACHQLSQKSSGTYLLFVDADVRVKPQLLNRAVGYVQKKNVKLLSIFPEQIISSAGEWKTVPIMNWILLTFLPLPLVRLKWFSSLSAANGQFMLFEGANYRANQWHLQVKNRNVEDILIAKTMKKNHYSIAVLLGKNDIACRMYGSFFSAIKGFSLNIHQYFGGSRLWLAFYLMLVWFRLPFFLFNSQLLLLVISLLLILFMRMMVSSLSQQPILKNIELYPHQIMAFTRITMLNFKNLFKGKYEWKGRVYKIEA